MKRTVAILLALVLTFAGLTGGCAQKKTVSVGTGGTISAKDESTDASAPAPEPTATPDPTEAPTPTPTEAPGWFYHYDRILVDEENVQFTLQTLEYDFDGKTLTAIMDYTNTGEYNQIVVFINILVQDVSYLLYADTSSESDKVIYMQPGEKRTITFSTGLTDENLAQTDFQHLSAVSFDLAKFEATDKSKPDTYGVDTLDPVEVELPPAA